MFASEQEMSVKFENFLKTNIGDSYLKECTGLVGIPDFIFYITNNKKLVVISFELKLRNWKRATQQAFRYKTFSNLSFVVLSSKNIKPAVNNIEFFEKYNIGLVSFDSEKNLKILFKPKMESPYSEGLNKKILLMVKSHSTEICQSDYSLEKNYAYFQQLGFCN